jgi:hypothetical protein
VSPFGSLLPPQSDVYPRTALSCPRYPLLSFLKTSPSLCLSVSVANPIFSSTCRLFVTPKKVNSFAIKQIQPLLPKHPGWGGYPECFYGMPGYGGGHPERNCGTPGVWVSRRLLCVGFAPSAPLRYPFCRSKKLSASVSRCLCGKSHLFNALAPLVFSCLSFSHSFPLFSAASSLFSQKHRGWGTPSAICAPDLSALCVALLAVLPGGMNMGRYENHKRDRKENQESYE